MLDPSPNLISFGPTNGFRDILCKRLINRNQPTSFLFVEIARLYIKGKGSPYNRLLRPLGQLEV